MIRVRDILLSHLQAMSPAERKVARALLDGYPQAGLRSTHVLAEQAGTSAPTVLRMVARIGIESYTELQARLREEIVHELNSPVRRAEAAAEDPPVAGFGASVRSRTDLIERTAKAVDEIAFQAAVDLLAGGPTSVLISGGYYSRFIAEILARQLDQVIPNVEFLADPLGYDIGKLHAAGRRSVVVTFDFRRYQAAPQQIAGLSRAAKASLIVITDEGISPAAEHADVVLTAAVDGIPFDSFAGVLTLTEALVEAVFHACGERSIARMRMWEERSRLVRTHSSRVVKEED